MDWKVQQNYVGGKQKKLEIAKSSVTLHLVSSIMLIYKCLPRFQKVHIRHLSVTIRHLSVTFPSPPITIRQKNRDPLAQHQRLCLAIIIPALSNKFSREFNREKVLYSSGKGMLLPNSLENSEAISHRNGVTLRYHYDNEGLLNMNMLTKMNEG